MKRSTGIALLILALLLAFAAGVAAGGGYELHLVDGEEAVVYCAAGVLHSEPIDDLTFYHRCGGEAEHVFMPVWIRE